jgi:hypothetical protein
MAVFSSTLSIQAFSLFQNFISTFIITLASSLSNWYLNLGPPIELSLTIDAMSGLAIPADTQQHSQIPTPQAQVTGHNHRILIETIWSACTGQLIQGTGTIAIPLNACAILGRPGLIIIFDRYS